MITGPPALDDVPPPELQIGRYRCQVWPTIDKSWDALVGTFADSCLEQMAAYAQPRWGASRLGGLLLRDGVSGETVALALAVLLIVPLVNSGMSYVKFGPLWRRSGDTPNPDILAAALMAGKRVFGEQQGLAIRIMPPPDPLYEIVWQQKLAEVGFHLAAVPANQERYLVDLRLSEREQTTSLGAGWRANLKKALAVQLDIREVDPQRSLPAFLTLYRGMVERKAFHDHHHADLLPRFVAAAAAAPQLGLRLFLADYEGKTVAGSVTIGAGERVFVPFSASDEAGRSLRAGYSLRWWMINALRGANARWLDLGGDEGNEGLRSFKTGLVGKSGRIVRTGGEYQFSQNTLSSIISSAMSSAYSLMRGWPPALTRD